MKISEKNYFVTNKYSDIIDRIRAVNAAEHIKTLILDDIGFVMSEEFFERSAESGYTKFTDIGKHMQQIISTAKNCREDLNIVFNWHVDDVVSDGSIVESKIRTIGKLLDDKYNPAALFSILLFTTVGFGRDGKPEFGFVTNRQKILGKVIPAKSPDGMFETMIIPNDLQNVITTSRRYFYGE